MAKCKANSYISKYYKPCLSPDGVPEAQYCKVHGCRVCKWVNKKSRKTNFGEEVCSIECRNKAESELLNSTINEQLRLKEEDKKWREELISKAQEVYNGLKEELKIICVSFYEEIKNISLNKLKADFIKQEISGQELMLGAHLIIQNSSLESVEKSQWKNIYSESNFEANLILVISKEERLLLSLAKQRKEQEEQRQEIVKEIKIELSYFSPQVDLKELPEIYHNFESLKTKELRKVKVRIIEAIKNKREEKKLLAFLDKEAYCADNELLSFIQNLENIASVHASQYEKKVYYNQKNQVDSLLDRLRKRWNNLNQETRLNHCRNNALSNFDSWLKEGENLVLLDTCPFRNFKEDVKKLRSESEIENVQSQAYQHIVEKFKKDVKKQLGAEEWDNEFQEIDSGKDFSAIKLARDNVRQGRRKSLEEFIKGAINKLQNLLDSNQEVNLSKIVLPTWKKNLRDLKSKSEVSAVAKKMEEEINDAASHAKKYKNQEESAPNQNKELFTYWKIAIVIISLGFFLVTLIKLFKKNKKPSI